MSQLPIDASEQLMEVAFTALDHGINSVRGGGPMTPFVLIIAGEKRSLRRFVTEELSEGIEKAREYVSMRFRHTDVCHCI